VYFKFLELYLKVDFFKKKLVVVTEETLRETNYWDLV